MRRGRRAGRDLTYESALTLSCLPNGRYGWCAIQISGVSGHSGFLGERPIRSLPWWLAVSLIVEQDHVTAPRCRGVDVPQ